MTILHVIESCGGSADFVLYFLKYLPQHNHLVIYSDRTFAGRFEKVKQTFPEAKFYHWKHAQREVSFVLDFKAAISLYRLISSLDFDVIHLHSSKAGFLGRVICALTRKKKVIYTPNGLAFLRKDVSFLHNALYILLEKFANWLSGEVISCSESESQALKKIGINGEYINNGTETIEFPIPRMKITSPLVIVTTGRATIQKNPALFNKIAKHFENNTGFEFHWIGGGELESLLTARNITVTGWIDHSSVIQKLQSAHLYISTALWEGLPFAVLEAMNLGKPLLLTNCVGNVDLVKENYNGYTFTTAEEAIAVIYDFSKDRSAIQLFGTRSHEIAAEKFNVKKMVAEYEIAYNTVISCQKEIPASPRSRFSNVSTKA